MKRVITRILLVGLAYFVTFEGILQLSVRWRESSGELALMALTMLLLVGLVWAVLPAFRQVPYRLVYRGALVVGLFLAFFTLTNLCTWHVRPNIGLCGEPGWVAEHPGFQKALRARIEANRWW